MPDIFEQSGNCNRRRHFAQHHFAEKPPVTLSGTAIWSLRLALDRESPAELARSLVQAARADPGRRQRLYAFSVTSPAAEAAVRGAVAAELLAMTEARIVAVRAEASTAEFVDMAAAGDWLEPTDEHPAAPRLGDDRVERREDEVPEARGPPRRKRRRPAESHSGASVPAEAGGVCCRDGPCIGQLTTGCKPSRPREERS
jgi:hypothetical protein